MECTFRCRARKRRVGHRCDRNSLCRWWRKGWGWQARRYNHLFRGVKGRCNSKGLLRDGEPRERGRSIHCRGNNRQGSIIVVITLLPSSVFFILHKTGGGVVGVVGGLGGATPIMIHSQALSGFQKGRRRRTCCETITIYST